MKLDIPLDKMSTTEKLIAVETLWEDLSKSQDSIPSPSWHADVLTARERRVKEGKSSFIGWSASKENIRKLID